MEMSANVELKKVNEFQGLRGFSNLLRKENRAWWGTRRWWINALLWTVILGGLTAVLLFGQNDEVTQAAEAEIAQAGGLVAYTVLVGLEVFFQFGVPVLAIGAIILMQDSIIGEKQNGVAEWLLSKPVTRRAYVLAKLVANVLAVLVLFVGLPAALGYGLVSARMGAPFDVVPFISGIGIMTLNTLFYLTFTLMLGTFFNSRGPVLGLALASVLGGGMLGGLIKPLLYITPWMLPKLAALAASGQELPTEVGLFPLVATALWSLVFVLIAMAKFKITEF
jgi:ABC-2 type transport system permease protein